MTKQVQRRRGTNTQHTGFTGADGEISVNTTNKSIHVHDGATAGGFEAARADLLNVDDADVATAISGGTVPSLTITSADINGGTIDGTTIGANSAAAITGTTITGTSATVTGDLTVDTNTLYVDSTNNRVGVGTASPATALDVTGTITSDGLTVDGDATIGQTSGADRTLSIGSAGALHFDIDTVGSTGRVYLNATNDSTSGKLHLQTVGADRLFINNNGDISFYEDTGTTQGLFWDASAESLGIGTTSPTQKLDVSGTDARIYLTNANTDINMDASANGQLYLDGNGYGFGIALNTSGAQLYTNSVSRDLIFGVNETEVMRVTNETVEITSPSADPLKVERNTGGNTAIQATDGTDAVYFGMPTGGGFAVDSDANLAADPWFKIEAGTGNVGIGNTAPDGNLTVGNTSTSGDTSIRIKCDATSRGFLMFGDAGGAQLGDIMYDHSENHMRFRVNNLERLRIESDGAIKYHSGVYHYAKRVATLSVPASSTVTAFSLWNGSAGQGHYLVTASRNGASVATRTVAVMGSSTASASYLYDVLAASGLTLSTSGSNVRVTNTGAGDIFVNVTAIPLNIEGN